ncbi:AgmX/PglI C-terminal domain-containing protein [Pendulispora rubella]|uniref:AgmX/PglI C-terminal domain-containing protein n=1 Tax=Pendulispora rubella TaxID=2741070 RepID=A0ABZ2KQ43_9BACT
MLFEIEEFRWSLGIGADGPKPVGGGGMGRAFSTLMSRRRAFLLSVGFLSCLSIAHTAWAARKALASQGLSQATIQQTVRAKFPELRQCYEDMDDQPPMRVEMHFTIGPDGKVTTGHVESDVRPVIVPCITRTMFSLVFPRPVGGDISVVYSVNFAP